MASPCKVGRKLKNLLLPHSLLKLLRHNNVINTADIEWRALMQFGWLNVEDAIPAVGRTTASLLADEGKGVSLSLIHI